MVETGVLKEGLRLAAGYVRRSLSFLREETVTALKFDHTWKLEKPLFDFKELQSLEQWIVGCDADIGGLSEAYWGQTPQKTALFWGTLSTEVPPNANFERSGYAGIRSKEKPFTLFHHPRIDTSMYRYLAVRAKGDSSQWYVNLRTDSIYPSYVWQHRLHFQRPGEWETVMIPLRDFVLTSHGYVQQRQMAMDRTRIKTVGFSIMRQPGDFSLELDWIKAMNTPQTIGDLDLVPHKQALDQAQTKTTPAVAESPSSAQPEKSAQ
ncbi:complex I intermediate-associated protein 30-domain-containing protein [Entophlyctis helioformis]|nr:complex I intermediate-associated protein 30-domain-containing protein [Entophlyctis helioformis]